MTRRNDTSCRCHCSTRQRRATPPGTCQHLRLPDIATRYVEESCCFLESTLGLGIRRGRDDRDQNREIPHFSRAAANFGFSPEGNGMYPGSVPGIISMDVDTKENSHR